MFLDNPDLLVRGKQVSTYLSREWSTSIYTSSEAIPFSPIRSRRREDGTIDIITRTYAVESKMKLQATYLQRTRSDRTSAITHPPIYLIYHGLSFPLERNQHPRRLARCIPQEATARRDHRRWLLRSDLRPQDSTRAARATGFHRTCHLRGQ